MLGILLLAQGNLAQEFKSVSAKLLGEITAIKALNYCPYTISFSELKDKVKCSINNFDKNEGVVILTDCMGSLGTRVAVEIAQNYKNVEVISGINLAMLLNLIIHRKDNPAVAAEYAKEAAKKNILRLREYFCQNSP